MKCKTGIVLLGAMLATQVGFASPITEYSVGKGSLDVNVSANNKESVTNKVDGYSDTSMSYDLKNRLDYSFTAGVGQGYGIQYRNMKTDSNWAYNGSTDNVSKYKAKFQEFNVLKSLSKDSAAFVGAEQVKTDFTVQDPLDVTNTFGVSSKKKTIWQVGYIGKAALAKDVNVYGIVAIGKDLTNYDFGVSKKLGDTIELNVGYREKKIKNVDLYDDAVGDFRHEITAHGMYYGMTLTY